MTLRIWILVGLLTAALAVTTVGWIRASGNVQFGDDASTRFERCTFDGERLVLNYLYGANQAVAPYVDPRGDKIVVEFKIDTADGSVVDIGLLGQASFAIYGADKDTPIQYADGQKLDCKAPDKD